eukprot:gene772-biopygen8699
MVLRMRALSDADIVLALQRAGSWHTGHAPHVEVPPQSTPASPASCTPLLQAAQPSGPGLRAELVDGMHRRVPAWVYPAAQCQVWQVDPWGTPLQVATSALLDTAAGAAQ